MSLSSIGEQPIFVDSNLRRRRLVVAGGTAVGGALILVALALVSGFTSPGPHRPPVLPDAGSAAQQNALPAPGLSRW
jgi:hypothetical protein